VGDLHVAARVRMAVPRAAEAVRVGVAEAENGDRRRPVGVGGAPEADERSADAKPGLEERSVGDGAEEHQRQALAQATNSSARLRPCYRRPAAACQRAAPPLPNPPPVEAAVRLTVELPTPGLVFELYSPRRGTLKRARRNGAPG
jgi:hypothetical protein